MDGKIHFYIKNKAHFHSNTSPLPQHLPARAYGLSITALHFFVQYLANKKDCKIPRILQSFSYIYYLTAEKSYSNDYFSACFSSNSGRLLFCGQWPDCNRNHQGLATQRLQGAGAGGNCRLRQYLWGTHYRPLPYQYQHPPSLYGTGCRQRASLSNKRTQTAYL